MSLEFKGESKYQAKWIILKDGTKLDLEKITHALIIKENEQNFCISQKINDIEDCKIMSNQAFMISSAFKFMGKYGMSFDKGLETHIKLINKRLKDQK